MEESMIQVLGCKKEPLLMNYLGLPLSCNKLGLADWAPTIARVDKYLSGWELSLLSYSERITLINAVLNAVPIYSMCAYILPASIIHAIDKKRRAFLWTGEDKCSGAKCLVAWEQVCKPKQEGGLGIRCLRTQNKALILKKLCDLTNDTSPWASWIWQEYENDTINNRKSLGHHWRQIQSLVHNLQLLTKVSVGNGKRTSFREDKWIGDQPLSEKFPALFSHVTQTTTTLHTMHTEGLQANLLHRLTRQAVVEQQSAQHILGELQLQGTDDVRITEERKITSSKYFYNKLLTHQENCKNFAFTWQNKAPLKGQFFTWLATKDRLPTKYNLHYKNIVPTPNCDLCNHQQETATHILLTCPFAVAFWRAIQINPGITSTTNLYRIRPYAPLPAQHYQVFFILCFWLLWNHRHEIVFTNEQPSLHRILRAAISNCTLWIQRLNQSDIAALEPAWRGIFNSAITRLG
uniref:Reverse transcriptase zinc-binding domain-containing protein n=1 Tax=Oryza brachyantha TaxID=4533 RepID=J3LXP2_ORYBR